VVRRHGVALVAVAVASFLLAGCGSAPAGGPGAPPEAGGTLTFANWQWNEPGRGEKILEAVEAYNEANPAARIEPVAITRADYEKTISTQIGSGGGPDLLASPAPFFHTMADADVLVPLDDVLDPGQEATLRPNNAELRVDGSRLGLVWGVAPYALFWNQRLLDEAGVTEPPRTFDELLAAATRVHERTGKIGFATRHQLNEEDAWWDDFASWVYGYGGGWSTDGRLTIDSPQNVAAVEAFARIYSSGAFAVGDDASTFRSKFGAGEVAFVLDNATVVSSALANSSALTPADVGSAVLPFPSGSSGAQSNVIAINANSPNQALAKDFLHWMYTEGPQRGLADAQFPAGNGTTVAPPAAKVAANRWVDSFYTQLEDSQSLVVPGFETETPQIRNIVLTRVQQVLTSDVSAAEALAEAQQDAEQLR
jgi:multiple sugar transport system substrate-binding protein